MMEPRAAETLISEHLTCLPIESLPVGQCAGAVLRENIYAERDQPPFDRVAMDGVALASGAAAGGRRRFRLQATQGAGEPPVALASEANCVEVMTGAVLPSGCDTVVPVERLHSADGYVEVEAARCHRALEERSPARQRPYPGCAVAGYRQRAERAGDRGGGLGRHGAGARQQPAGDRRGVHRQ
jgi:molybdopterin biosynthesis enzyme